MKSLNGKRLAWPKPQAGPETLSKVQFNALFEEVDWTQVTASNSRKPVFL
ncbi:hypothetical protein [Phaeobacter sp. JH20_02]